MINSVYGKTMNNLRKRTNVRVVSNEKDYLKHTNKPTVFSQKIKIVLQFLNLKRF